MPPFLSLLPITRCRNISKFDHFEEITGCGSLHYFLEPFGKSWNIRTIPQCTGELSWDTLHEINVLVVYLWLKIEFLKFIDYPVGCSRPCSNSWRKRWSTKAAIHIPSLKTNLWTCYQIQSRRDNVIHDKIHQKQRSSILNDTSKIYSSTLNAFSKNRDLIGRSVLATLRIFYGIVGGKNFI